MSLACNYPNINNNFRHSVEYACWGGGGGKAPCKPEVVQKKCNNLEVADKHDVHYTCGNQ